jgi:hypothetical protein
MTWKFEILYRDKKEYSCWTSGTLEECLEDCLYWKSHNGDRFKAFRIVYDVEENNANM